MTYDLTEVAKFLKERKKKELMDKLAEQLLRKASNWRS